MKLIKLIGTKAILKCEFCDHRMLIREKKDVVKITREAIFNFDCEACLKSTSNHMDLETAESIYHENIINFEPLNY